MQVHLYPHASGNGKTISIGTLELDSIGSGSESNYTLSGGNHTFNVTARPLTFSSSRNYDGTTTANTSGLTYTFSNLVSGESLGFITVQERLRPKMYQVEHKTLPWNYNIS